MGEAEGRADQAGTATVSPEEDARDAQVAQAQPLLHEPRMKLQIEKPVYGGAGLAHQTEGEGTGRTVFVPFTLPGELVEARLLEQKDGFGEASLVQVLSASKDRVEPACAHFGQCGGCQYQHAAYSAQVQMKSAILRETLERAGLTALPATQTHTGEPWAYRNTTRLRVA